MGFERSNEGGGRAFHEKKTGQRLDLLDHEESYAAVLQGLQDREAAKSAAALPVPHSKVVVRIMAGLLGVMVVGLMVLLVLGIGALEKSPPAKVKGDAGPAEPPDAVPVSAPAISGLSGEEVARGFLAAGSWEERRRFVRDPERAERHLAAYAEEVTATPMEVADLRPMGMAMPDGLVSYERFAVQMAQGGMRFLCVVQTEQGPFVDYDAFARHGSVSFEELVAGTAAREVRVFAEQGYYFGYGFSDEEELVCFKLTSPDWPATVWGYAPVDSETALGLARIVSERPQRVMVALRPEAGSHERRQFVVEELVANGWVRSGE